MAGWHHGLDGRWVWVNSGRWWWTGRPGVLRFTGSQRVGHDWATELNWTQGVKWFGLSRITENNCSPIPLFIVSFSCRKVIQGQSFSRAFQLNSPFFLVFKINCSTIFKHQQLTFLFLICWACFGLRNLLWEESETRLFKICLGWITDQTLCNQNPDNIHHTLQLFPGSCSHVAWEKGSPLDAAPRLWRCGARWPLTPRES